MLDELISELYRTPQNRLVWTTHVCYSRQNFLLFYNNNSSLCSSLLCYNNSFLLYLTFMLQQFILVASHYYVTTMHSGQILIEYATTATIRIANWNPHILIWWISQFINNDKRNTIPAQSSKSMDKFSHGHDLNTWWINMQTRLVPTCYSHSRRLSA